LTRTFDRLQPSPPRFAWWLIAKSPTSEPYPCMCAAGCWSGKSLRCRCRGRTDVAGIPSRCCGHQTPAGQALAVPTPTIEGAL
jgi:hypothetical protein